ncbi:MAG: aspartate kinase [Dehalococcoidales bacterium]|jgi:aspartate kinase|nr:aspartate kinase [Dehalococcoidales bacterium]
MSIVVQKYGGSSVADLERIFNVARRVARTHDSGKQVVVVISAMGDTTDDLIALAHKITDQPDSREMDMLLSTGEIVSAALLAMALHKLGYKAISLSGRQAGIQTDNSFSKAKILKVESDRIVHELNRGNIVIVAGFQGITGESDITTLGRGGSDTTAVALAISLKATACERYTDVDGIYTADPRICPEARKLKDITYDEMLELTSSGSKAMHYRAVELAGVYNMPVLVASSFNENPGTLIHGGELMEVRNKVRGIAHDLDVAKITLAGIPNQPGIAAAIFEPLAMAGISVDTIVQNALAGNITDLTFTVSRSDLKKALEVIQPIARSINAREVVTDAHLGKVSIVGTGMQNTPGYAARMFSALYKAGINIQLITTSEIRITCIIDEAKVKEAVQALHRAFELEKE